MAGAAPSTPALPARPLTQAFHAVAIGFWVLFLLRSRGREAPQPKPFKAN